MKTILFSILIMFSMQVYSMDGGQWVEDWWEGEYQHEIVPQQALEQEKREATRCEKKILYYRNKLRADADNQYYIWKYEVWKDKCE